MNPERQKRRRALSPVVSALILAASVLVIGGAVWGFSQSAMTISAEAYAAARINMSETISERFIIEHVAYIDYDPKVWIYNYGKVDIEIKIEVKNDVLSVTYPSEPKIWIPIMAGGFKEVDSISYTATSGDNLVITAYTRRGNSVYYTYIVP